MNLKEVLKKKAEYPVRLIATSKNQDFIDVNDELGIEAVDFSCGNLRCHNKMQNIVVEVYYDKETWKLNGEWVFKNI
jgi:hypothetical protein